MSIIVPHNWGKIVLSIIIVNYNGKKIIESCLESIKEYLSVTYEIIIVDNASTDGSQKYITHKFPDINLITNRENEGFAKGNNIGVKHSKGKYILLLNNDAYLSQDIKPLIDLMESDKKVGVAGIKMHGKESEYRYSAGFFPVGWRLFKISALYIKRDGFKEGKFNNMENLSCPYYEVDWVEGSFILTRRSVWNLVGGLDDSYFMYVEDVDYCKMVKNAGFKIIYYPLLSYIHIGGYGIGRMNLIFKGLCRYHKKHSSRVQLISVYMILIFGLCLRYVLSFIGAFRGRQGHREKLAIYKKSFKELLKWN